MIVASIVICCIYSEKINVNNASMCALSLASTSKQTFNSMLVFYVIEKSRANFLQVHKDFWKQHQFFSNKTDIRMEEKHWIK